MDAYKNLSNNSKTHKLTQKKMIYVEISKNLSRYGNNFDWTIKVIMHDAQTELLKC